MARGIGHRQKKVVAAKKVWIRGGHPPKISSFSPQQKDEARGKRKPGRKPKGETPGASSP